MQDPHPSGCRGLPLYQLTMGLGVPVTRQASFTVSPSSAVQSASSSSKSGGSECTHTHTHTSSDLLVDGTAVPSCPWSNPGTVRSSRVQGCDCYGHCPLRPSVQVALHVPNTVWAPVPCWGAPVCTLRLPCTEVGVSPTPQLRLLRWTQERGRGLRLGGQRGSGAECGLPAHPGGRTHATQAGPGAAGCRRSPSPTSSW